MHAHETVTLAALVATCGRQLIKEGARLSSSNLNDYGIASRCRMDRWTRTLSDYEREVRDGEVPCARPGRPQLLPVVQEILAGEALVRVWTAIVAAHDRRRGQQENEPLVHGVFLDHERACNRAMRHMLAWPVRQEYDQPVGSSDAATTLEKCRRRTERWTDLLLGYLLVEHDVVQFAFDANRARDFAHDIGREERVGTGRLAWSLTLGSLQAAFCDQAIGACPNPDLNARIAASILACFEPERFESVAAFQSLWMVRLLATANDVSGMIDDLLRAEP